MSSTPRRKRARGASRIGRDRQISVRSARRAQPDLRKFARAIVSLALAQAEADARAQRDASTSDRDAPDPAPVSKESTNPEAGDDK